MNKCFPKILKDNLSRLNNWFISLNETLSAKINLTPCFISSSGPRNGGGGYFLYQLFSAMNSSNRGIGESSLYNKLNSDFRIKVKR